MGDPRHFSRKYDIPRMQWNKDLIFADKKTTEEYGLKSKKEIWKADTAVRNLRKRARQLLAGGNVDNYDKRKDELLGKLIKLGIFTKDHKIEDVLKLTAKDLLERRLQTLVFRKGLAITPKQARQLITHGHILVDGKKRFSPGSLIGPESSISYTDTKIKAVIEKSAESKGKRYYKDKKGIADEKKIAEKEPATENKEDKVEE